MKSLKVLVVVLLLSGILIGSVVQGVRFLHDGKLHLFFCDVGQGDGILLKSPEGKIVLIDVGPGESMSSCLATHLPFWVRTIDLMIITHPHLDHFAGGIALLERYKVKSFITEDLTSDQEAYQLLLSEVKKKNISSRILSLGDRYRIGKISLLTVGPTEDLLKRSSPNGKIGESKEFASLLLLLQYGRFSVLFPGDSQAAEIEEGMRLFGLRNVSLLQAPHHGSSTGLTKEIVAALQPKLAVISVGAKNRYHHPSLSTLSLFQERHIPISRTDRDGTIHIISTGDTYTIVPTN